MTTKILPKDARQHVTAGPYSPVLEIDAGKIVVISGQVAVDAQGNIIGTDIEDQTRYTLANCQRQLKSAGCGFSDVFKVNVYLSDVTEWARFNAVYSEAMPHPRPVRTTVGAVLLPGFCVEMEMWAAKPT